MWHLYIIRCADSSLYTGITNDIMRRIKIHNSRKGGSYTRSRAPVDLVYHEACEGKSEALKRECQIKKWTRNKKLALIRGDLSQLIEVSKSRD